MEEDKHSEGKIVKLFPDQKELPESSQAKYEKLVSQISEQLHLRDWLKAAELDKQAVDLQKIKMLQKRFDISKTKSPEIKIAEKNLENTERAFIEELCSVTFDTQSFISSLDQDYIQLIASFFEAKSKMLKAYAEKLKAYAEKNAVEQAIKEKDEKIKEALRSKLTEDILYSLRERVSDPKEFDEIITEFTKRMSQTSETTE